MPGAQGQKPKSAPKSSAVNVAPGTRGLSKQSSPPKNGSIALQRSSAAKTNIRKVRTDAMPGDRKDCCGG